MKKLDTFVVFPDSPDLFFEVFWVVPPDEEIKLVEINVLFLLDDPISHRIFYRVLLAQRFFPSTYYYYLPIFQLVPDLLVHVTDKVAVLVTQDLGSVINDYQTRKRTLNYSPPLSFLHLVSELDYLSLDPQSHRQQVFHIAQIKHQIVSEHLTIDRVNSGLLDETALPRVFIPLQEHIVHPLLVSQYLYQLVHFLFHSQTVVLPQTLQHSPSFLKLYVRLIGFGQHLELVL